jgi:hypothetical protein
VRAEFERCWPWLAAAMEHSGNTHSKEHIWGLIEEGNAHLHPLPHGAIVTCILDHPTGIRELNFWLSGGNLDEIIKGERLICEWAKSMGCHRVTATGRHGWKKVFPDYRAVSTVFVKELK